MNNIISQKDKDTIDAICDRYYIKLYTINGDGSIDVEGSVDLSGRDLIEIPIVFNKVTGFFDCSRNNLESLYGSPKETGKDFYCQDNFLTSLEYCPKIVKGYFSCASNKLTTLEHSPTSNIDKFYCGQNQITTLEHCTTRVNIEFNCYTNNLPESFVDSFRILSNDEQLVFIKYMQDYEVWLPRFSEENVQLLIADIKEGLL